MVGVDVEPHRCLPVAVDTHLACQAADGFGKCQGGAAMQVSHALSRPLVDRQLGDEMIVAKGGEDDAKMVDEGALGEGCKLSRRPGSLPDGGPDGSGHVGHGRLRFL
jgi:hypothetical protein